MRPLYRRALANSDDFDAVEVRQRQWAAARDEAATSHSERGVAGLYSLRINELGAQR